MENPKIEQARHMYFAQAKTQREIARLLEVNEKTVYNWIKRHSWDQLRQAARQAPALITENICSQLAELQNSIARREPGLRYGNKEESQIILRLVTALEKMKKFPGLAMNMQVMTTFSNWASTRDQAFTRDLSLYSGLFLQGYAKNGYYPYELEFGLEKINPIDPNFNEEHTKSAVAPANENHTNDVIPTSKDAEEVSLQNNVIVTSKEEPENHTPEAIQNVDNHNDYTNDTPVPTPEKTGNQPGVIPSLPRDPDRSDDFPWRKWLPDSLNPDKKDTLSLPSKRA